MEFFQCSAPEAFTSFDEEKLRSMIREGVRRAMLHGLQTPEGFVRFVSIFVLVDPEFDKRREVRDYFSAGNDPDLSMQLLSTLVLRRLRKGSV
jgi:hypothetical protein